MSTFNNSVQLIGHLGKDVDLRTLENGRKLAKVSIATNEYYKSPDGEKQVKTQWHQLVAWGPIAERMQIVLKKGNYVAVKGKLTYNQFETKEGITRYVTEIHVQEFHLLDRIEKNKETEVATS